MMNHQPKTSVETKLPPGCGCIVFGALAIIIVLSSVAAILGLVAAVKFLVEFIFR